MHKSFTLNDCHVVRYDGRPVVQTFAEGGATSANWHGKWTIHPAASGARMIVSNLDEQRKALMKVDAKASADDQMPAKAKEKTLVIEW